MLRNSTYRLNGGAQVCVVMPKNKSKLIYHSGCNLSTFQLTFQFLTHCLLLYAFFNFFLHLFITVDGWYNHRLTLLAFSFSLQKKVWNETKLGPWVLDKQNKITSYRHTFKKNPILSNFFELLKIIKKPIFIFLVLLYKVTR